MIHRASPLYVILMNHHVHHYNTMFWLRTQQCSKIIERTRKMYRVVCSYGQLWPFQSFSRQTTNSVGKIISTKGYATIKKTPLEKYFCNSQQDTMHFLRNDSCFYTKWSLVTIGNGDKVQCIIISLTVWMLCCFDKVKVVIRGPFYWHGISLIPAWISNHTSGKVWDEII